MYSRLAYTKLFGCFSYGCVRINNKIGDFNGPFFDIGLQEMALPQISLSKYMKATELIEQVNLFYILHFKTRNMLEKVTLFVIGFYAHTKGLLHLQPFSQIYSNAFINVMFSTATLPCCTGNMCLIFSYCSLYLHDTSLI